jgi:hypothetical protein
MSQTSAQTQTKEVRRDDSSSTPGVKAVDMKLEVIVTKTGYAPKRFPAVTFQAGETVTLPPVTLTKE